MSLIRTTIASPRSASTGAPATRLCLQTVRGHAGTGAVCAALSALGLAAGAPSAAADPGALGPPPALERTSAVVCAPPQLSYPIPGQALLLQAVEARLAGRTLRTGDELLFDA